MEDPVLAPYVSKPLDPHSWGSDRKKYRDGGQALAIQDDELWPDGGQGSVHLPDFYIGKHEVTFAQFKACMNAKGCSPQYPKALGYDSGPEYPVVNVSWDEALQYCAWLEKTIKASLQASPELTRLLADGWRVGLPSEAEWEKAARGTDGRTFPWGERMEPDRANYLAGKRDGPTPVGSFPQGASPYGILDMSGNVWEWTRSLFKPYPYVSSDGREDLNASGDRVLRGGSFNRYLWTVRVAWRYQGFPTDERSNGLGFRVVLSRF